jgi:hypothetical protein
MAKVSQQEIAGGIDTHLTRFPLLCEKGHLYKNACVGEHVTEQQMISAIAVALVARVADGVAEGGKAAIEALTGSVRRKFENHDAARSALADAAADPANDIKMGVLRQELAAAANEDRAFDANLRDIWRDVLSHLDASDGGMVNIISGTVHGNVVQARDVHGGITFGIPGRDGS